jgi:hypothetical protein
VSAAKSVRSCVHFTSEKLGGFSPYLILQPLTEAYRHVSVSVKTERRYLRGVHAFLRIPRTWLTNIQHSTIIVENIINVFFIPTNVSRKS